MSIDPKLTPDEQIRSACQEAADSLNHPSTEVCGNCKFFSPFDEFELRGMIDRDKDLTFCYLVWEGCCLRYPPTIQENEESAHPTVGWTRWCGEYRKSREWVDAQKLVKDCVYSVQTKDISPQGDSQS